MDRTGQPLNIVVLAGGDSAERTVSQESGDNVAGALRDRGHAVTELDPQQTPLSRIPQDCDIVLPMLHGTGAEDGVLQGRLTRQQVLWLGSSAAASRLTFDKVATRTRLTQAGIPMPRGIAVPSRAVKGRPLQASRAIGYPQVVKPAAQGSSVGVTMVGSPEDFPVAHREVRLWGAEFLVEQYIPGREITVPVVDGVAFPAVEILAARPWYDYTAKYHDDDTRYVVHPPGLPDAAFELSRRACELCGVSGIARVDLRVTDDGQCFILEINTIPGMTSHSLVPRSAAALGLSVGQLCEELLLRRLGRLTSCSWEQAPAIRRIAV